jgi:transposase, IS30 family
VPDRLEKRWSAQQISQALRAEFPGEAARHVAHETIYQALYRLSWVQLRQDLERFVFLLGGSDGETLFSP